jgi:hypothetical protein
MRRENGASNRPGVRGGTTHFDFVFFCPAGASGGWT